MSLETVCADLAARAPDLDVMVTEASTATVQLAAAVHSVEPGQIAKTLALRVGEGEFLLVPRGDARLSNQKAKAAFGGRPRMLGPEDVLRLTSHAVGGVCPFGLPAPLTVYCDESLKVYDEVIPAGGDTHASVRLPLSRLAALCGDRWVDACGCRRWPIRPEPAARRRPKRTRCAPVAPATRRRRPPRSPRRRASRPARGRS